MSEFEVSLKPGPSEAGKYAAVLKNRQDGTQENITASSPEELKNAVLQKAEGKKKHSPAQRQAAEQKLNEMVTDTRRGGPKRAAEAEDAATEGYHCYCWWIFCACVWLPW